MRNLDITNPFILPFYLNFMVKNRLILKQITKIEHEEFTVEPQYQSLMQRIIELETQFSYQDDQIDSLNLHVLEQEKRISALSKEVNTLKKKLNGLQPSDIDPSHYQPPHY